jgi:hypothetical protein
MSYRVEITCEPKKKDIVGSLFMNQGKKPVGDLSVNRGKSLFQGTCVGIKLDRYRWWEE